MTKRTLTLLLITIVLLASTPASADREQQVGYFDRYLAKNRFATEVSWDELSHIFGPDLQYYAQHRDWFQGRVWREFAVMPTKGMLPEGTRGVIYFPEASLQEHFQKHQDEVHATTRSGAIKGTKPIGSPKKYVKCANALAGSISNEVLTIIATHIDSRKPVLYRYHVRTETLLVLGGEYFTKAITYYSLDKRKFLDGLIKNTTRDLLIPKS